MSTKRKANQQSKTIRKKSRTEKANRAPQYVNANSYKHFLSIPATNGDYIKWAFGLREHQPSKLAQRGSDQTPSTYYKTIETLKQKHETNDLKPSVNVSQFEHLALHRQGCHPSAGLLRFETSLRETLSNKDLLERQKRWVSIPVKDKHEAPKLLNSASMRKKIITVEDMVSACDGQQNYPGFTEKIVRSKNINDYRHMIKGKVYLPSIGWQTGLRNY